MTANNDGQFEIRESGTIGQEIVSPRGTIVAWTTDQIVAQVIANHLNRIVGRAPRMVDLFSGETADA